MSIQLFSPTKMCEPLFPTYAACNENVGVICRCTVAFHESTVGMCWLNGNTHARNPFGYKGFPVGPVGWLSNAVAGSTIGGPTARLNTSSQSFVGCKLCVPSTGRFC